MNCSVFERFPLKMNEDKKALLAASECEEEEGDELPTLDRKALSSTPVTLKVYPQRWLMLFLFSLTTLLNGSMFMGLSPVVEVVAPYYNVSAVQIEWLSNMFMVVYIFVAMPSAYVMSKYGVRTILTIATGCGVAATSLQYAGSKKESYRLVMIGQFFAAVAYGNIIQIPGKLSAVWFAPQERGISTSIGVFMNIMGVAVGFIQPAHQIPASDDNEIILQGLKSFYLSRVIIAFVIFLLTLLFYKEHPPTPTSVIEGKEDITFIVSLKMLLRDVHFNLMAHAYGIYFGLFVAISVIISQLVTWQYGGTAEVQHLIGWMGFTCDLAAIFSCLVIGFYLDRYAQHKAVAVFLNCGSMLLWLLFVILLTHTNNFQLLFLSYVLYGTVGIPYFASGLEQAAEMTSPVPEGTSSTVVLLLGNIYGFIMIFTFGVMIEEDYPLTTVYVILALYVISTAFVSFAKTELKRSEAESTSTISFDGNETISSGCKEEKEMDEKAKE